MIYNIYNNIDVGIWGDGNIVRDFIHIDDLVDFVIKALELNKVKNKTFNIGTGMRTTINEVLDIIKLHVKRDYNIEYKNKRDFDLKYSVLDIDKVKRYFGWSPKIKIDEGVKKIIEKYEEK